MNIYMVVWKYFPCKEGGAERQCRKVVNELSRKGHRCTVLTARVYPLLADQEEGVCREKVVRLGKFAWVDASVRNFLVTFTSRFSPSKKTPARLLFWLSFPTTWLARLSFILALRRFLRSRDDHPDVIHVHEGHWIAGAVAWASEGLPVPVVCKEATYPYRPYISYDTPFRKKLMKARSTTHLIAITEAIRMTMLEHGVDEDRISLIPNGVNIPSITADIVDSTSVVYIGNFDQGTHQKAFDILFEAWVSAHGKRPNLVLTVLGGGDSKVWQNYIKANKCHDSVFFKGSVPDVGLYLREARMLVLPSRIEGLSNALLEAMSWGVPAIVSDIPAHRNLVINGENGVVVKVDDSIALANEIVRLSDDDDVAVQLGSKARKTIASRYSIEGVVASLTEMYMKLQHSEYDN